MDGDRPIFEVGGIRATVKKADKVTKIRIHSLIYHSTPITRPGGTTAAEPARATGHFCGQELSKMHNLIFLRRTI